MTAVIFTFGKNSEFISPFIYTFSDDLPAWIAGSENATVLLNIVGIWAAVVLYMAGKYLYDRRKGGRDSGI